MRTWLDQLTERIGHMTRVDLRGSPHAQNMAHMSDYRIMREVTANAAMINIEAANRGMREDPDAEFLSLSWPFLLRPDELRVRPYACFVGRDLARLFGDAAAAPNVCERAIEFAKEKVVTYIDIADRAFRLGATHQLKAIFIMRVPRAGRYVGARAADPYVPDATDRLRLFGIMGPIGELAVHRMAWYAGGQAFECDHGWRAIVDGLLQDSGKGIEEVAAEIEDLIWLTLAYAAIAEPYARQPLAMADDDLRNRSDRAARRQRRQFTLFKVERLRPPADGFGRGGKRADNDGWQLERRITVRGHFKMQRHGPNGGLRKLIFVAGHFRGPADGAPLHSITALDRDIHDIR